MKIVDPQGVETEFTVLDVRAFTFQDLLETPPASRHPYPMECKVNEVSRLVDGVKSQLPDGYVNYVITFNEPLPVYTLVTDGWLPPPYVSSQNFLVDRNVVRHFNALSKQVARTDQITTRYWFDMLNAPDVILNPLPYAFEGARQRVPTFEEFVQSFREAQTDVHVSLPKIQVMNFDDAQLLQLYQSVSARLDKTKRELMFLLEFMPRLAIVHGSDRKVSLQQELFDGAKRHGLTSSSLTLIAALSCLHDSRSTKDSPGRGLLKPKQNYTQENAYNAIADLHNIELLWVGKAFTEGPTLVLCTCDKSLALFWCGLVNKRAVFTEKGCEFTFTVGKDLFPSLDEAGIQMIKDGLNGNAS